MFTTIAEFFHEGGATMYITATAGIIGWVIIGERGKKLYFDYMPNLRLYLLFMKKIFIIRGNK